MVKNWNAAARTSVNNLSNLTTFFEFCVEAHWTASNLAGIRKRQTRNEGDMTQSIPFSDKELERMFCYCGEQYGKGSMQSATDGPGKTFPISSPFPFYTGLHI